MSANNTSWFHCGRCGSLFLSAAGESDDRFCTTCGCKPSLGVDPPLLEATPAPVADPPLDAAGRKRVSQGRSKHTFLLVKLVSGWLLFLASIVVAAHFLWPDASKPPATAKPESVAKEAESAEDMALLNEAGPLCTATLSGFLSASSPEQQNQFVRTPIETAPRMARFYSMNPLGVIDPKTITAQGAAVVHLPGLKAVETHLRSEDGRNFDAVFIKDHDEWLLDWEHYARYSDHPWALFLAGNGEEEGEFRLLARERLPEERRSEATISMVLYAPRFGYANDTGFQSPEFLVRRETRNGKLLEAAFKLERDGRRVFDVNLPGINPEGLIRLRLKIRRFEVEGERRFEIKDVIACHWYSVDDPGVVIQDPDGEK